MKLIIAGSRDLNKYQAMFEVELWLGNENNSGIWESVTELVTGDCETGPDQIPYLMVEADMIGREIIKSFPANWEAYGRAAGPIRNATMADYADAALVVWDGKSRGSSSMINEMLLRNKPVYEIRITKE